MQAPITLITSFSLFKRLRDTTISRRNFEKKVYVGTMYLG